VARYTVLGAEAIRKKGWWLAHKWLILRRLSQVGILLLFMLGPWAGIWIIKGNLSSSLLFDVVPMTDPFVFLQMLATGFDRFAIEAVIGASIIVVFYVLIGGRLFCSWVCPVNLVTDASFWLRRKLDIRTGANFLRNTKYWMLGMVLLVSAVSGVMAYELINPVSILHRGIIFGMGFGWFLIAAIFLFDVFVAKRGWCTNLCPMGAFYGLLGKVSPIRVRADARSKCNDCAECFVVCPEPQIIPAILKGEKRGIPPVILSGECTNCGRCIDICGADVFHFGLRFDRSRTANSNEENNAALLKQQ
jgi:ferredoxin-type protein NapH